jgi:hypothetical protein
MRRKIGLATLLVLAVGMSAQQTIPLYRQTCAPPSSPTLDCTWDNSDQSCGYGAGNLYAGNSCQGPNGCATETTQQGKDGDPHCRLLRVSHCCAASITMNSACTAPVTGTVFFTEVTTIIPCC